MHIPLRSTLGSHSAFSLRGAELQSESQQHSRFRRRKQNTGDRNFCLEVSLVWLQVSTVNMWVNMSVINICSGKKKYTKSNAEGYALRGWEDKENKVKRQQQSYSCRQWYRQTLYFGWVNTIVGGSSLPQKKWLKKVKRRKKNKHMQIEKRVTCLLCNILHYNHKNCKTLLLYDYKGWTQQYRQRVFYSAWNTVCLQH